MVDPRGNYHRLAKRRSDCGAGAENGANDVGASGNRDCALCRRHGMDPPRNQGHSRFGYERPGQVGGYWNSGGRGGFGVFCLGRSTSPKRHDRVKLKAGNPQSQFREADHQPIPISLPAMPRRPDSDVSTGPWVLRFPVGVVGRHRRGRSVCSLAALEEFSSRRRVLGERPRTSCPRGWLECQSGTDGRDDAATHAPGRSDGTPPLPSPVQIGPGPSLSVATQ